MKHDQGQRVFCVSMQRTGTTSVGKFLRDFGYAWAGWAADERNAWSRAWYEGDFERIFASPDFRAANAFEDSPWFLPGFYKVLHHRFPGSRFVLFTRDADAWFASMVKHSGGNVLGRTRVHCKAYRREREYFELLDDGAVDDASENVVHGAKTLKLAGRAEHYQELYRLHAREVRDFFERHAPGALHVGELEDPAKWRKLGAFLGLDVPADYAVHENRSEGSEVG